MQCPECGSDIQNNAGMCTACGASLRADTTTAAAFTGQGFIQQHQEKLLLGAAVCVVLGGALLLVWQRWDGPIRHLGHATNHANGLTGLLLGMLFAMIVVTIVSAQRGRLPFIRRIPGLNAIDEAVGRATEMGRPVLFSPGLSGLSIVSLQALAIGTHVARYAARFGARFIVPVCDQTMMPITEQAVREVYSAEGKADAYRSDDVRFLSDRQFAYAAGVTGILHREKVAASFLFGQFYAESLILAENGQAVGAIQIASTPDLLQIPFFVVTCDYTLIGDEFYAASAYLSREPTLLGSLVGQDLGKALLFLFVVAGMILAIWFDKSANPLIQWLGGS